MNQITVSELKAKLEAGDPVEIVDIRESDEYSGWHIHGSRNVPVYNALRGGSDRSLIDGAGSLPMDQPIVTVCRMGIMSQKAASALSALGFDAQSLVGGIRGWGGVWSDARIPLVAAEGAELVQVRRNGKGCLSYIVGSAGEAAVVDPSVDSEVYLRAAERDDLRITRVLETHVHADHLSRARELCEATGAKLTMRDNDRVTYEYEAVGDGDEISVGDLALRVVATPGHTVESVSYLVGNEVLLTGDALFVNAVGRPDLETGDAGADSAARRLYDTLHNVILGGFPDELVVYPAHHGKGIAFDGEPVGASLGDLRCGLELLGRSEQVFVATVLGSLQAKPPNFETIISINEGKSAVAGFDPLDIEAGPNRCAAG